ncbi:hypothetical protein F8388_017917 [Cannabis sativa]|uniref:Uncharacterized protein n=1 Tax=Cannabis sativa TaxID=3483 RepID=A0A7J6HFR8_CANSA|nr:hypothetical protein F8388_017917 [Cannabis sativa]
MATKNCSDGTSHHSSIALLQERFRQLQRAKEMREEKELLRLLSESERSNPTTTKRYEAAAAGFSFHSESLLPHSHSHRPPSHHQSSIYHLQPNLPSKHGGNLQTSTDHTTSIIGNITSTSAAIKIIDRRDMSNAANLYYYKYMYLYLEHHIDNLMFTIVHIFSRTM